MTDFPTPNQEHVAGLKLFRFIPVDDVLDIPDQQRLKFTDITLAPGAVWLNGVATIRTLKHTDTMNQSAHGDFYSNSISLFYPGVSSDLELMFDEMINRQFLIRTRDYQGNERLIGTLDDPLDFSRNFDSAEIAGRKGYNIQFSNRQRRQSYFIDEIASSGAFLINQDGELEVVESVPGHTFSFNADGQLVVTGIYDYKFYLNSQGEVVFDEFRTA